LPDEVFASVRLAHVYANVTDEQYHQLVDAPSPAVAGRYPRGERGVASAGIAAVRALDRDVIGQGHHPRGAAGTVTGWVFAHRPSNRQRNGWVVSLLGVQPADRVLEIGFGPGLAVAELVAIYRPIR
jgi:hypothetical protein